MRLAGVTAGRIGYIVETALEADARAMLALEGYAETAMHALPAGLEAATHYRTSDAWAVRPTPPAPPTILAGQATAWTGLPVGAVVTITDPLTAVVAGTVTADAQGAVSLTLPAGPWRFDVADTFPAVAARYEVTVDEQ